MKHIIHLNESQGIRDSVDLFKKIKKIDIDYSQENFILICLDTKNKIISQEIIFKGGLNHCVADPKTIFRKALLVNANCIVVAHNHPSGDLEPSVEDRNVYYALKEAGNILTLRCVDSIIFNKKEFYSFLEEEG